ncbi:MAG: FtsX-like permease family protein, partial [Mollicutes bacterium]|nr:FtsX-like permease family protein [Mollicutes bacterium]
LSVIGSTVLLMLGFGLLDISHALKDDTLFGNVASSMGSISFVIILFALSMAIVVIYSLANMNIQDRQRELATLKVLGYHDKECSFYTFREIMIISIGSALLALPISALLMYLVFSWLDFGSVSDVQWYSYIFSFAIVILSTVLVNLLLYPKIKTVDMNDSLKTLD